MKNLQSPILTLNDAAILLHYTDTRSVVKWCERNDIPIFSEEGGKRKYIIKQQLEQARLKDFIGYLKNKHGEQWMDAYQSYMNLHLPLFINPNTEEKINLNFKKNTYRPKSEHEKNFLATLLKKTSTL